ncbi:neutral zinc metallopeptidase [Bradyrhizobium sp. LjRoot220]|uniref:KPN_02809 family neutral zinc metallopeptidase n=1 Tax=Bradyrhizobium sp. LjRoot220 TaxID=3342284 RepID=UPI003ECE58A5
MLRRVRDAVMSATNRQQQPYFSGSLSKDEIYLKPANPTVPPPAKPAVTAIVPTTPVTPSISAPPEPAVAAIAPAPLATPKIGAPPDEMGSLISGVVGEVDDRWGEIFQATGLSYSGPRIVLFRNATNGGRCGMVQSATGPFYCPADKQIYLDTHFFREVETRFRGCTGNACKFAAAYIIAHQAGHHVQNLLGILPRVKKLQEQASKAEANALQVKVELQADCLSGVWVNREENKRPGLIEPGDIEAALTTAAEIGGDTLQRQTTGRVVPDSFTHGTAAQRKQWFMTGYKQGTVQACNTFAAGAL